MVVGGAHRRGVPAVLGGASAAIRHRGAVDKIRRRVGPFRSRADAVETAALLARFTGVRTCTTRLARSALHGPSCPERELSPCPAPRDVTADEYAAAPARASGADRRATTTARCAAVLAHIDRPGRARPLRDRRAAAGPRRHRHRGAVARPATARAGRGRRNGRGPAGRRRRLAPRGDPARPAGGGGQRPPRGAADARRRRDMRWRTSDSADRGAAGRRTRRGDRADRALAGPARRAHRARRSRGWASPAGLGGPVRGVGGDGAFGAVGRRADSPESVRLRASE